MLTPKGLFKELHITFQVYPAFIPMELTSPVSKQYEVKYRSQPELVLAHRTILHVAALTSV